MARYTSAEAEVIVVPTFRGFSAKVSAGVKGTRAPSVKVGVEVDRNALREAEREVENSANKVSALRDKEATAAEKVQVAEAKLADVRARQSDNAAKVLAAETRLAQAKRDNLAVSRLATKAIQDEAAAQERLSRAQQKVDSRRRNPVASLVTAAVQNVRVDVDDSGLRRAGTSALKMAAALSTAASAAVALGSAAPAIGAVGAALAATAGAAAVLPALFAGVAASVAALVIGTSGVADAFKSLSAADEASGATAKASAKAREASSKAIKSAIQAVEDAQQSANRTAVQGARSVATAERSLEGANRSAKDAQEDLTRARKDAVEQLEDLELSLSGSHLAVNESKTAYKQAVKQLEDAKAAGASALDLEDAENGVKRAAQSIAEAKERYTDLRLESEHASRVGVEGSDNVVKATRNVSDANRGVQDAERELAEARSDAKQANDEAAKAIIRAQADVREASKSAGDETSKAADKAAAAMAKLSPNAREFVNTVRGLKGAWDDLKLDVQDKLFDGIASRVGTLAEKYLPLLKTQLGSLASSFNHAGRSALDFLASKRGVDDFSAGMKNVSEAGEIMGRTMEPVTKILMDLFVVGSEFLPGLAQSLLNVTEKFQGFIEKAKESGQLKEWIGNGIQAIKDLFGFLGNVVGIIVTIFSAANEQGATLFGTLRDITGQFKDFLNSEEGQKRLKDFFTNVKDTIDRLKPGVEAVFRTIGDVIAQIAPMLPGIADSFSRLAEKLAPILGAVAVTVFTALATVFEWISKLPEPVLWALVAVFAGILAINAAKGALDKVLLLVGAFSKTGTFGKAAGLVQDVVDKLTGSTGVNGELDKIDKKGGLKGTLLKGMKIVGGLAMIYVGIELVRGALTNPNDPNAPWRANDTNQDGSLSADERRGTVASGDVSGIGSGIRKDIQDNPNPFNPDTWNSGTPIGKWLDEKIGNPIADFISRTNTKTKDWLKNLFKFDEIPAKFSEMKTRFTEDWNTFWGGLGGKVSEAGGTIVLKFSEKWTEFTGWLGGKKEEFTTGWNEFWDGGSQKVSDAATSIGSSFSVKWSEFTGWLGTKKEEFTTGWNTFWDGVGDKVGEAWQKVSDWGTTKWTEFTGWLGTKKEEFTTGWNTFWDGVGNKVGEAWQKVVDWGTTKWSEFTGWLQTKKDEFKLAWDLFWDSVGNKVGDTWQKIVDWGYTKWTEFTGWLGTKKQEFKDSWDRTWDDIGTKFSGIWETIKTTGADAWTWIKSNTWDPMIKFVTEDIPNAFGKAVNGIAAAWSRIQAATREPIQWVVDHVYNDGIRALWNKVAGTFGLTELGRFDMPTGEHVPAAVSAGRFADGGLLPGYRPGVDTVNAKLSDGEAIMRPEFGRAVGGGWVDQVNAVAKRGGPAAVKRFMSFGGERLAQFANGGMVEAGKGWASSQAGKPYSWGGVGPQGYDCSGFMSAITNFLLGQGLHSRRFATGSFGPNKGAGGFIPGMSTAFTIGVNPNTGDGIGHMAGTLGGMNVESRGGDGVVVGPNARGADNSLFPWKFSLPQVGGNFTSGGSGGGDSVSVFDELKNLLGGFDTKVPGIGTWTTELAQGMVNKLVDAAPNAAMRLATMSSGGSGDGGGGVQQWRGLVERALGMMGQPLSLVDTTLRRMNQESGGNARAINNWDINAANGTPSKGLMQVIDPTFRANRDSRAPNDIWDPLANLLASMKYAMRTYGSLPAAYDKKGGYDSGGWLMPGDTLAQNRSGVPEAVLTGRQWKSVETLIGHTTGGGGSSPAVMIGEATFVDPVDLDMLMARAEFANRGAKF